MNEKTGCSRCGKPAARDDLMGLCADCLLAEGLGSVADATAAGHRVRFVPPEVSEIAPLFPQLEVLEPLGCGGMGAVYKARQKNLDRFVALKILPPDIGRDPAFAERFVREAKALAKLSHTNIVTLYEFGQAGELFYFLMEYVDGVNLGQLLRSGRVSPREALAIVPQICDALQYAHDAGIVHRDIKPENILLDRKGRVKVADFGLAKLVSPRGMGVSPMNDTGETPVPQETPHASLIMGTPQYMAPEQVAHPSDVDHRADIYSLGVVFYQMLTGELPKGDFAPPSKKVVVDVRLDEVVLRALEKKPELRYQQVSDVKTMVETIATTPSPVAPEVTLAAKPDAWLWAPNQPPLVREICSHMTEEEKREAGKRGMLFGFWNAATFFGPVFCVMFMHGVLGWVFGLAVLAIGLSFYPLLLRVQKEQLCSTAWARQRGITPEQIKRYEGAANWRGQLWLGGAGLALGLALLACSTLVITRYRPENSPLAPLPPSRPLEVRSPVADGEPEIERVVVCKKQATVVGQGAPGAWLRLRVGDGSSACTFSRHAAFTATYGLPLWGNGIRVVVKEAEGGQPLLTLERGFIGPMTKHDGRIVFREGSPMACEDGSYLIGEFRPVRGTPSPVSVSIEKSDPSRMLQATGFHPIPRLVAPDVRAGTGGRLGEASLPGGAVRVGPWRASVLASRAR